MADVVDLRGRARVPPGTPVLADATGRRARLLARVGRLAAAVLLVWLVGLLLAGLGLLPGRYVPFGQAIVSANPPALKSAPALTPVRATGAVSARSSAAQAVHRSRASAARVPFGSHARAGTAPATPPGVRRRSAAIATPVGARPPRAAGHGTQPGVGAQGVPAVSPTAPGRSVGKISAPGQTRVQATPGHTKAVAPGRSSTAPGTVKHTTTTSTTIAPGKASASPGHTLTHGVGGATSY